jgi:hypothetical protein
MQFHVNSSRKIDLALLSRWATIFALSPEDRQDGRCKRGDPDQRCA